MINLIIYFFFSAFILPCMSSENENVPPMSGFYTDGLDQAHDKIEIVYPERVSKDGSFVSYYLPQYYTLDSFENRPRRTADGSKDLSGDAIHFFVPIEGEKHHLELWPNLDFIAPGLVIERRDARDVENINKAKLSQVSQKQCHYNGRIVGKPDSRVALSTCYGLAGYIQLPAGEEYLIEPVKDSKPAYNKEHPHIMYKRSGIRDHRGISNCLTKGSAKEALGERLQWESVFGNQVRKEFSAINMNDLVRENIEKTPKDYFASSNNLVDTSSAASLPKERSIEGNENKFEETLKSKRISQNSYPNVENDIEENVGPSNHLQYNSAVNGKFGKFQVEYGNKLKQKPLKEELGSIKLPDVNISPFNPLSSQSLDGENFKNKPDTPSLDKERRLYEADLESRRVKRDLSLELEDFDSNQNKNLEIKRNVNDQSQLKDCVKNVQNYKDSLAGLKSLSNFDKMSNKQLGGPISNDGAKKMDYQMTMEDSLTDSIINKGSDIHDKVNLDNVKDNKIISDVIGANVKKPNSKAKSKPNEMESKQHNLANNQMINPYLSGVNQEYLFSNNENNVKRDIHLDTSEKSWQSGEKGENYNTGENPEKTNHKDINHLNQENQFLDTNLLGKKLENRIENNIIKESKTPKLSKAQKSKTHNDDDIMVSAIESVVKDMDKTKVKKDVMGGFTHLPSDNAYPLNQPLQPKTSVKYNDFKYIKLDDATPVQNLGDPWDKDENMNKPDDSLKSDLGFKDSRKTFEGINEHIEADETPNHSNVDEIIIKIKTPEGTVSEVKQNLKTDSENLGKNSIDLATNNNNNNGAKDTLLSHERDQFLTKNNFKTSDAEKSKRGVDSKSQSEVVKKVNSQGDSKNSKDNSAQEFNIIVESPKQNSVDSESNVENKQKVKRDDNTIHLVIETEPEVKSSEGRSSESAGSNIFCQGKNCLEIKPIYLNDTNKVSVSNGSSNNVGGSKDKVVEKRDTDTAPEPEDSSCGLTTTESPLRCHDFAHKVFNLELMITVDYKVVQMHEDDDIENFILTIINMVSSNFDDKSIGLNMNVVLVRLILLTTCIKELDSERFNPQELLENFCTWQVLINPGRDDHPHHHDLAIFISKMEKCEGQVMGLSYMTSVCRPDKACVVCVDEGLLLANTITHQIGHSLGADHDDGQNTGCAAAQPDGSTYHMAPTITETSNSWSVCSRDAIIQFVQTQGSWCLGDFPVVRSYNFPLILPGQIYSAAQQCKLNFHMTAIPCSVGPFCNKLYCQITDKLCATKGDPPADGTFCASNMWCFHKQCVHVGRRPGAINGEWGPWTEWSLCTRSCGGGVSSSYRICNNPKPENGGRFCIGERIRHRICQTKPCQGFTESFRDLQCKRTEDRPFRGKIHNWIQYQSLFINIECSLVCQNRKGDVVMRSPVVADGTPCKAGTRNVCIQGSCRSVGCDYVIDSNAKEDACGICHGNGTECRIIQGIFDEAVAKKGLIEFLRIPKESGMIFVREVSPSQNTLVVSGSVNRVFYLNGLGTEDSMAGDVAFGVTHGVYEKRGGMERVFIRGPTKEDLIFYVLFRDLNKGIHYQYATLEVDPTYIPRYQWQFLDWDPCSDPCSGGSQRARAKCVEDRGGVVDDKYCTESSRPLDIHRPCNDFPCQAKWWVSVWSDCICTGATSVMFRSVLCMRATDEGGTRAEVVRESECSLTKKPPTQKPCNYTDDDNDCPNKRSISDDSMFHAHRDLRRAVNPRLAFSAFSPTESEGSVAQDAQISTAHSLDDNKNQGYHESKYMKKSRAQINKNMNSKGTSNKAGKTKLEDKDQMNRKKITAEKVQVTDNLKPIDLSSNEVSVEPKPEVKSEESPPPMESKGKQIAKVNQKNRPAPGDELRSATAKQTGDDSDSGVGNSATENCESSGPTSMCPTEENTSETPTTCKDTCAPQPHKKTTCCKTTPHKQYAVKTTVETTTMRPVAVKLDELNINNFAITVVPLDFVGKKRILPQSDPEFINLGAVGQFGVADELNASVIVGQEALDLLEFARSNASEEPVILHEDMHN